jgi:hypothetical protein
VKAKIWYYKSSQPGEMVIPAAEQPGEQPTEPLPGPSVVEPADPTDLIDDLMSGELPTPLIVTPSPAKRHAVVSNENADPDIVDEASCQVCHSSGNVSYWLGCGNKNPVTKRLDCPYWVHQKCIGLHFMNEKQLEKVPFFCPRHPPSTSKGKGKGKRVNRKL